MKHYSTWVSSMHKADMQKIQRNLSSKRKELLALWDQKKKSKETAKSESFFKKIATLSIVSSVSRAEEETTQNIDPKSEH